MSDTTPKRKNDPEGLKKRILAGALQTFAEYGMQGARMEQIAELAQTTKRMVVYHFINKEKLYIEVLEQVYQAIRQHETGLNLTTLEPEEAMIKLVEASFDYHVTHPDFMRLVCTENLLRGRYIMQSERIKAMNKSTLDLLDDILSRGQRQGIFIDGLDTVDVHRLLSSICVHHVSNRYTFHTLFTPHDSEEDSIRRNRQLAVTATLRYIRKAP
ncbi:MULTISPECIES: TetR family transcriptional regulator [Pantoea]|jgi:AcrR family transcriptional regulator|uniref:TetR family transcriptional regulator n=2 Tax=Pantoea dispersa TaxID=59814 RepID=A0A8E1V893_9GAMM|nr:MULTISPECIES: TetR family transcriptional regulator [Pantoea]MBK4770891.1 TetR family transcriptional regulator [Pantoea sp. Morm]ERH61727.1 TetR family transcriptional regulator [Pantoea dispersa EGD-AAK13]KAF0853399.1 TetR family transcriptional regulator [Pantoea dispersa 625]KTR89900.1 TetR family transcriptional regulator [Pantoea dispersa]KTS18390.1 TetR family transcriptional regulator [Pantoea dispersa]